MHRFNIANAFYNFAIKHFLKCFHSNLLHLFLGLFSVSTLFYWFFDFLFESLFSVFIIDNKMNVSIIETQYNRSIEYCALCVEWLKSFFSTVLSTIAVLFLEVDFVLLCFTSAQRYLRFLGISQGYVNGNKIAVDVMNSFEEVYFGPQVWIWSTPLYCLPFNRIEKQNN